MVPPKAQPKKANVPAQKNIFSAMKSVSRLNTNFSKAKTAIAVREYDGPDGDVLCKLARTTDGTKDGTLFIVLEFHVIEGEYAGTKIVIYYGFKDEDTGLKRTVEMIQEEFFVTLQLMGVDTVNGNDDTMSKELNDLRVNQTPISVRVKSGTYTDKKTKEVKPFKRFNVIGIAQAEEAIDETEYVEEGTEVAEEVAEEVTEEVVEEVTEPTDESGWEEESPELTDEEPANCASIGEDADSGNDDAADYLRGKAVELGLDPEDGDTYADWKTLGEAIDALLAEGEQQLPSAWVGYQVKYKGELWTVQEGDDESGKVKIRSSKGKVYTIAFDQVELPTE